MRFRAAATLIVFVNLSAGAAGAVGPAYGLTGVVRGGGQSKVSGLFAALTTGEGETWSIKRLITDGGPARKFDAASIPAFSP